MQSPERKVERTVDWSETTILTCLTREQINLEIREALRPEQQERLKQLRQLLVTKPEYKQIVAAIDIVTNSLQDRTAIWPYDELNNLAVSLSPQAQVYPMDLLYPDSHRNDAANLREAKSCLEQLSRRDVAMLSDSHTSTTYLLHAAELAGWSLAHTAVLSFDRHPDYSHDTFDHASKATVMSDVMQKTAIANFAVVGSRYNRTYGAGRGNKEIYFLDHPGQVNQLLEQWQRRGVTSIYTTIDLDCLRLLEQGYTATDFNPLEMIMVLAKNQQLAELLQTNPDSAAILQKVSAIVSDEEMGGIPASAIGRTLAAAKRAGFSIGVEHPTTKRRLVGDIVEYTPPDHQDRTAKIVKALMNRLISVAQAK